MLPCSPCPHSARYSALYSVHCFYPALAISVSVCLSLLYASTLGQGSVPGFHEQGRKLPRITWPGDSSGFQPSDAPHGRTIGGEGRIRTSEGNSQQIYSLPRLAASVPLREARTGVAYDRATSRSNPYSSSAPSRSCNAHGASTNRTSRGDSYRPPQPHRLWVARAQETCEITACPDLPPRAGPLLDPREES